MGLCYRATPAMRTREARTHAASTRAVKFSEMRRKKVSAVDWGRSSISAAPLANAPARYGLMRSELIKAKFENSHCDRTAASSARIAGETESEVAASGRAPGYVEA